MKRLWTTREHQQIMAFVRKECCNYDKNYHECVIADGYGCALETSLHPCCNYFRDVVWPLDKSLPYEVTEEEDTRKCQVCGKEFFPGSNRAKYCVKCAKEIHRKQKNASARRIYAKNPDN